MSIIYIYNESEYISQTSISPNTNHYVLANDLIFDNSIPTLPTFDCRTGFIFDGNCHTITLLNISGIVGLFINGGGIIRNLGIITENCILDLGGSFLVKGNYFQVFDSYTKGDINHLRCGGLFAIESENCIATDCYFSGDILHGSLNSGGIFGSGAILCSAIRCYNIGNIIGENSGGIFGSGSVVGTATDCYSIGNIGDQCGGIFGAESENCNANTCYSSGSTTFPLTAGGIFATNPFGSAINNDCYCTLLSDYGTGGTITTSYPFTVSTLPTGFNSSVWDMGAIIGSNYYPILKEFQNTPWIGYTNYNSEPTLGGCPPTPPPVPDFRRRRIVNKEFKKNSKKRNYYIIPICDKNSKCFLTSLSIYY
jgi:hypothetical protein